MTTKHTRGCWSAYLPSKRCQGPNDDRQTMVLHPDGERLICRLGEGVSNRKGTIPPEEIEANAVLIASAPELLGALKLLVESLTWEENRSGITYAGIEPARAAIAKAEGTEA